MASGRKSTSQVVNTQWELNLHFLGVKKASYTKEKQTFLIFLQKVCKPLNPRHLIFHLPQGGKINERHHFMSFFFSFIKEAHVSVRTILIGLY